MSDDWVDDESMPADETLRRFEALEPNPTTGRITFENCRFVPPDPLG